MRVCVCEGKRESGLCPMGLSVSLIKDRRLTERECVARLACRPRQQHTTLAVWRERATGGGGCLKKKKKKARCDVEEDTAVEIHIYPSLYSNRAGWIKPKKTTCSSQFSFDDLIEQELRNKIVSFPLTRN